MNGSCHVTQVSELTEWLKGVTGPPLDLVLTNAAPVQRYNHKDGEFKAGLYGFMYADVY